MRIVESEESCQCPVDPRDDPLDPLEGIHPNFRSALVLISLLLAWVGMHGGTPDLHNVTDLCAKKSGQHLEYQMFNVAITDIITFSV